MLGRFFACRFCWYYPDFLPKQSPFLRLNRSLAFENFLLSHRTLSRRVNGIRDFKCIASLIQKGLIFYDLSFNRRGLQLCFHKYLDPSRIVKGLSLSLFSSIQALTQGALVFAYSLSAHPIALLIKNSSLHKLL